jgi:hypothetical protein
MCKNKPFVKSLILTKNFTLSSLNLYKLELLKLLQTLNFVNKIKLESFKLKMTKFC